MHDQIDNEIFRKILLSYPAKAIEFLYRYYYHSLVSISRSLTHNWRISEDIVQELFVHVWEKHKWLGQHHDKSIRHYLVRVVKNMSITYYKKNFAMEVNKLRYLNGNRVPSVEKSIETNLIESEIYKELREVVAEFPKRERECLLMKIDDEMSINEIALSLNVTRKAVERSLTSARKRLQKYWTSRKSIGF